jgi:lipopolysaccharide export system permease protein
LIIARYITKEILWTFFAALTVLLLIALSNRFALYLAKAATGQLPLGFVCKVVALYIPELLSYLIPLSFFIALLFAFGRLYADSEMTVLMACGISWTYICRLTLTLALLIMLFVALLTLWFVPHINKTREQALSEGETIGMLQSLMPGRFQTDGEGNHVFYIEDMTKDQELKGVFIAESPNMRSSEERGWTLITAEAAFLKKDKKTKDVYLVLKEGYRYQGVPGLADYTVIQFTEYGRAIPYVTGSASVEALPLKESSHLMSSEKMPDIAEFQWRFSLPLSVPVLALLALPLARVRPRQGRFAKFLPAMVIYITYYNLFTICKRWVAAGNLPSYVGVWWVHLMFLLLGILLLAKESGWFMRNKGNTG